jgi:PAS domain S-box-containing protein
MNKPLHVLIVEDSEDDAQLLLLELRRNDYEPVFERVESREAMEQALGRRQWDIVISDYIMPRFSGLHALGVLKDSGLDIPLIIVSGNIGEAIAVEAMRKGAHDYIIKGNLARLAPAVERELREAEVHRASKRAEEERVRLAAAAEAAAEAIVITDIRGIIQYVNAAFVKMTGYTKEESVGHDLHMLDSGKQDADFYRSLRDTLKQDGVWTGRLMNKKKTGAIYHEDCTYSVIKNPGGEVINYVSIKRDVTERLRLESIAEAVNTMDSIGYIFSGVRHEIGNPINSINMILGILRSKLDVFSKENIREYVDRMASQLSNIEALLKSLKSFNMYESQEPRTMQISSFIEKLLPLVREEFKKKGVTLDTFVDPNATLMYADPRALQQVMLNIFTNASDAMNGRDNPKITVKAFRSAGMIGIRVEDNGCGIPEDKLKDLFKPFYTTKAHGTGLGLVIVKKMLAKMNGAIEITSRKDEGTRVDIFIPAGKE